MFSLHRDTPPHLSFLFTFSLLSFPVYSSLVGIWEKVFLFFLMIQAASLQAQSDVGNLSRDKREQKSGALTVNGGGKCSSNLFTLNDQLVLFMRFIRHTAQQT